MARVQVADHEAFRGLVTRHAASLHRFAYRLMRNAADAEDVAQETLLRVWQHAATWEAGRVRFTTWLFRIAHNLCIDRFRRDRRFTTTDTDALEAPLDTVVDDAAVDGAAGIDAETRRVDVHRALAALPERQRTALTLCFYQGFGNQDAAAILDVSVDALESLLARARRTLRAQLAEHAANAKTGGV